MREQWHFDPETRAVFLCAYVHKPDQTKHDKFPILISHNNVNFLSLVIMFTLTQNWNWKKIIKNNQEKIIFWYLGIWSGLVSIVSFFSSCVLPLGLFA